MFDVKAGSKGKEHFQRSLTSSITNPEPLLTASRYLVLTRSQPLLAVAPFDSRPSRHGAIVWLMPCQDMKVKSLVSAACLTSLTLVKLNLSHRRDCSSKLNFTIFDHFFVPAHHSYVLFLTLPP